MAEMNFLKKAASRLAPFPCILSTARAVPFGYKPAGSLNSGAVNITTIDKTDFSGGPPVGPLAAPPEKLECLTAAHSP
jgi:hypothetical protein